MYEGVVQELIDELSRLPGVGPKSAQRIAFYLLQTDDDQAIKLSNVLREVKERVRFCDVCGNVSEEERCNICRDARRNQTMICVVEESKDVQAIERTREYRGLYHVLGGAISPIEGIIYSNSDTIATALKVEASRASMGRRGTGWGEAGAGQEAEQGAGGGAVSRRTVSRRADRG